MLAGIQYRIFKKMLITNSKSSKANAIDMPRYKLSVPPRADSKFKLCAKNLEKVSELISSRSTTKLPREILSFL